MFLYQHIRMISEGSCNMKTGVNAECKPYNGNVLIHLLLQDYSFYDGWISKQVISFPLFYLLNSSLFLHIYLKSRLVSFMKYFV